jgi:hypothetical protein
LWLRVAHHDVPWDDPAVLLASLRGTNPSSLAPKSPGSKRTGDAEAVA